MPEAKERCANCQSDWEAGDWETRFAPEYDDTVTYVDGLISGFVLCTACKHRYAFFCFRVIDGFLFHWVLVAAAPEARDYEQVLDEAWRHEEGEWLSLVEDLRRPASRVSAVCMSMSKFRFAWNPRNPKISSP